MWGGRVVAFACASYRHHGKNEMDTRFPCRANDRSTVCKQRLPILHITVGLTVLPLALELRP